MLSDMSKVILFFLIKEPTFTYDIIIQIFISAIAPFVHKSFSTLAVRAAFCTSEFFSIFCIFSNDL